MIKVFDAYAVLCWLQEEPGASYVNNLMAKAEEKALEILISPINIGEIYYRLVKSGYNHLATSFLSDVKKRKFPWRIVPVSNSRVWYAAKLKAQYRISYADAFAVGLARETGGEIVTRDPEIIEASRWGDFIVDEIPLE
ncbi:type II toxin-antitoxin system VapC family toxin [Moorellaceae bacterium AZ2]